MIKYAKVLFATAALSQCANLRTIEICQIDIGDNIAHCAKDDKKFDKPIVDLDGWFSISETDLRKIADKLEQCDAGN
jgi:hypothetical protein